MSTASLLLNNVSLTDEMEFCNLGDARRTRRLQMLVDALSQKPDASFPEVFSDESELEAFYRFLNTEHFDYTDILEHHIDQTIQRSENLKDVLVVHDTTDIRFPLRDEYLRSGLGRFSAQHQGFFAHTSLAVSNDGLRCPLGLLNMRPFIHKANIANETVRTFWESHNGLLDSELDRWLEAAKKTQESLKDVPNVIHVMDREADAYELFTGMAANGIKFVIRLAQERKVESLQADGETDVFVSHVLAQQPVTVRRKVELSPRSDYGRTLSSRKKFPARRKRATTLSIRGCEIQIPSPRVPKKDIGHLPNQIRLNAVEVFEENPVENEPPVRWVLLTTETIDTVEQLNKIVDIYRARWLIEEYFKSLKSGCSFEKRQLDSVRSLLVALAILAPVAWQLLVMRHLSRNAKEARATLVFSPIQIAILSTQYPKLFKNETPTVGETTLAMAKLGGHLKSNGPPGWITLARGYARMLERQIGWEIATAVNLKM